jgi:hypothetical protein
MADNGSILVTGAAGQLRAVGRKVTGLLLDRGFPVRARFAAKRPGGGLRALAPGDGRRPTRTEATSIRSSAAVSGSTSACPCPPSAWRGQ